MAEKQEAVRNDDWEFELQLLTEDALRNSGLSDKEREVIRFRFGMDSGLPQGLYDSAKHFKLTHERVRQIEIRALRKIREKYVERNPFCHIFMEHSRTLAYLSLALSLCPDPAKA